MPTSAKTLKQLLSILLCHSVHISSPGQLVYKSVHQGSYACCPYTCTVFVAVSFVSLAASPEIPALFHGVAGDKMLLQYRPHRMAQMAARHPLVA